MVILALKPDSEMFNTTFIFHPTIENFAVVLTRADFLGALFNNLIICILAVLLSMIVGVPAAYALARFNFKGKEDIAFTFLSFRFAPEILVIIPLFLIYQKLNLLDTYLVLSGSIS